MLEKFAEVGSKMAERGFVPGDKENRALR